MFVVSVAEITMMKNMVEMLPTLQIVEEFLGIQEMIHYCISRVNTLL